MRDTSHRPAQGNLDPSPMAANSRHVHAAPTSPDSGARWVAPPLIALILAVSAAAWDVPAQAAATAEPQPTFTERVRQDVKEGTARVRENVKEGADAVGNYSSDAFITSKVKAAMVANGDVKALDVNVTTRDRVVHLEGAVDTPEQRAIAERLARDVADVRSVDNRLQIKRR